MKEKSNNTSNNFFRKYRLVGLIRNQQEKKKSQKTNLSISRIKMIRENHPKSHPRQKKVSKLFKSQQNLKDIFLYEWNQIKYLNL